MAISAKDVKELRRVTGAGMMDCKKALNESDGDFDGALDYLRKKGQKVVAKRAGKDATEGVVIASAKDGKGMILSISCETDFAAKNEKFLELAKQVAEIAQEKLPATKEELVALPMDGKTVGDHMNDLTAIIGEKIEVSNYHIVEGESIASYIHAGSKIGVVVSYKDGGKKDEAAGFFRSIAMHIAAMAPQIMSPDEFEEDFVVKEAEALEGSDRSGKRNQPHRKSWQADEKCASVRQPPSIDAGGNGEGRRGDQGRAEGGRQARENLGQDCAG